MNKKSFRVFLLLYLLLFIVSGWIHLVISDKGIPQGIIEIADKQAMVLDNQIPLFLRLIVVGLYVLTILLFVVGYIGLFLFWRPSRYIFLFCVVLQFLLPFSVGWTVANSYESIIGTVEDFFNGMILALLFWGPPKQLFNNQREISVE